MKLSGTVLSFLLLFIVSLSWGSSYILMKKSLLVLNPYQLASTRLFIATWCFTPFAIVHFKVRHLKILKHFLIVGICGSGIPSFCFALAQTKINSSLAGALSSLTPIFTLILGLLFYRFEYSGNKIIGIILGLIGAILIIVFKTEIHGIDNPWFGLFIVLAAILYAWSTNTIGLYLKDENSIAISGIAFGLMAIPATLLFYFTGSYDLVVAEDMKWIDFAPVITLAIMGSVITSIAYFYLIRISGSLFASTVSYLTPVVAILFGMYDGEQLHIIQFLGIGLMMTGIILSRTNLNSKKINSTSNN